VSRRPALLAALAVLLGGCVYYNGMYNTNRLAKSARQAERDGRPSEARSLWGQVITRAETLAVRHPRSKYVDQANVLRGLALARLDQCPAAVGPLGGVSLGAKSDDLAEESLLALGRCQLELGDAVLADVAFVPLLDSRDSSRRREARFQHARVLRVTGRYEEALAILEKSPDPRTGNDLLLSLAGAGRGPEALRAADSLLAQNDTSFGWDSVIVALGRQNPKIASALVDRVSKGSRAAPELRAQRLYDDAVRLAAVDSAAAVGRLRAAAAMPGVTVGGSRARLDLLRQGLSRVRTVDELAPFADSLDVIVSKSGPSGGEAQVLAAAIDRLRQLPDSARPGAPEGDLRLFLGAEEARDGVRAPALAANLFRQLAEQWPASPYAPKALLAAQLLDPEDPSFAEARLDSLYPGSPYLAMVRGEDAPGYQALEDSLQAFALSQAQRAGAGRGNQGAGAPRPLQPGRRRDDEPRGAPSGRRRPQL
jgi:hypothetical protein